MTGSPTAATAAKWAAELVRGAAVQERRQAHDGLRAARHRLLGVRDRRGRRTGGHADGDGHATRDVVDDGPDDQPALGLGQRARLPHRPVHDETVHAAVEQMRHVVAQGGGADRAVGGERDDDGGDDPGEGAHVCSWMGSSSAM
jgi:hypothetical protein